MVVVIVIVAIVVLLLLLLMFGFNGLVRRRNRVVSRRGSSI